MSEESIPRKEISAPWLQILEDQNQTKTFEGRLNRGFWKNVTVGEKFIGYDNSSLEVTFEVISKQIYAGAGAAWSELGEKLIPVSYGGSVEEIDELYKKFYTQDQMDKCGFVAVEVKVVE